MRPFALVEVLLIVALSVLLLSFPLLYYGLGSSSTEVIAGLVLALIGCSMPVLARILCPMPEEKAHAAEQERAQG